MSDNLYRDRLEKLIAQAYAERADDVSAGASHTLEHYRKQVGYLLGLKTALDLCATAEKELNETEE